MATTTNYGWTTPDDTALVKDGASAIRTLGSSVDTTTKNLNPETTLGDISFRSSTSNVNTRLGIGSTSQVLTVTGGVPVWATPAGGGSLTLLSTTTLSGTTTTVSGIVGGYNDLVIIVKNINLATNSTPRLNINGSTTHFASGVEFTSGGSGFVTDTNNSNNNLGSTHLAGNTDNIWVMEIFDYTSTTNIKPFRYFGSQINGSSNRMAYSTSGVYTANTAVTSVTVPTSGSVTQNGGTILIYGRK